MSTLLSSNNPTPRFWNRTPFRSYIFNSISLLLPTGEAFIIRSMNEVQSKKSLTDDLNNELTEFIREEQSHQRAHRNYNAQLAQQGYDAARLEKRISDATGHLEARLSFQSRLALSAALEYLTALVSREVLRADGQWLPAEDSVQSRLWRWHCQEEIAHHRVALKALAASGEVGYIRRAVLYGLASLVLASDVACLIRDLYRADRRQGLVTRGGFLGSMLGFFWTTLRSWGPLAAGWLAYLLPLSHLTKPATRERAGSLCVRALRPSDIPQLLALEEKKWNEEQAASASDIAERIASNPGLCIGAFCADSGVAQASLFMRPTTEQAILRAGNWSQCARPPASAAPLGDGSLFGISLSSTSPRAVAEIFKYFWPLALKQGYRHIYLGSPIPGLATWRRRHPGVPVENYVYQRKGGLPLDPQLRYYAGKGFDTIIACRPEYFPHPASLNHGVVIRGTVPLSSLAWLWKRMPLRALRGMARLLGGLL